MRRPTEKLIAGIDLHSNNLVIGVINQDGKRIRHQKLDCSSKCVEQFLKPFKKRLESMAVESTYNWYWLVDGLRARVIAWTWPTRRRLRSIAASSTRTTNTMRFFSPSCSG